MKYTLMQRALFASLFVVVTAISGIAVAAFTISNNSNSSSAQEADRELVMIELHDEHIAPDSIAIKIDQDLQIVNRSAESRELFLGAGDAHVNRSDEKADDSHSHDHESSFSTGSIDTDEAWQGSFSEAGTYFLHDHKKAHINLLVVVYE